MIAHAAATRGVIPDLMPMLQPAKTEQLLTRIRGSLVEAAFEVLPGVHLFTDGSCRQGAIIGKPHAGYAMVTVDAGGQLRAVAYGAVPAEYPQTAAAAEA